MKGFLFGSFFFFRMVGDSIFYYVRGMGGWFVGLRRLVNSGKGVDKINWGWFS